MGNTLQTWFPSSASFGMSKRYAQQPQGGEEATRLALREHKSEEGENNTVSDMISCDDEQKELFIHLQTMERTHISKLPKFTIHSEGKWRPARVTYVIDGDSLRIATVVHDDICVVKCRLYGIDTPEISRQPVMHVVTGKMVKRVMHALLMNTEEREVQVSFVKFDNFGRTLTKVRVSFAESGGLERFVDLSEWLVDQHMAVPYFGERTRTHPWTEARLEHARASADIWLARLL